LKTSHNKYFPHWFSGKDASPFFSAKALRVRIGWYIKLRWLAITGVLVAVAINYSMLHFRIAYNALLSIVSVMIILNLTGFLLWRHLPLKDDFRELAFAEIQIIFDLFVIALLVYFSGGIQNPFFFLLIVLVILSGILFPGAILPYINAAVAAFLLTLWSLLEFWGVIPHYSLEGNVNTCSYLLTVLSSFYIITFSGIYIINNFMINYQLLKKTIEEKGSQLEHVIEERNKAFRFAAHELKSPMIAIKSTLDVVLSLYAEDMKPDTRNMVQRAVRRTDQIINMVKEMISISQYNLGIEKQEFVTVEYDEWLTQLVLTFVDFALQKNIVLSIVHVNDDFVVDIDKSGLESVVSNLVTNAIRYTPCEGKVFVISFRKKNCFGFSVKDTGIGISEEDKVNIFSEFFRSKKAKEMEQLGTGLGLNLVKEIVKRNNGTISVESEIDKGSTFTIEFPLTNVESSEFEYHQITKPYIFE
jgi:signal transduction histidine kinase